MKQREMRRLAMRFLIRNRRRNIVLGASVAVAVAGSLLLLASGESLAGRQHTESQRQHPAAELTLPASGAATLSGGSGWITTAQRDRIEEILTLEMFAVSPRIRSDALIVADGSFTIGRLVTVTAERMTELTTARARSVPAGSLLVGYTGEPRGVRGTAGFINLNDSGVAWIADPADPLLIRAETGQVLRVLQNSEIAPPDSTGNVLEVVSGSVSLGPEPRTPAVIAFDAAEIVTSEFPHASVVSSLSTAGRVREMSAGNIALLLRVVLMLPAIAAVIGTVLVTAESRSDEVTLLRTMGYGAPAIRSLFVREILIVASIATAAALLVVTGVVIVIPGLRVGAGPVAGSILIGLLLPPGLAFLTARRFLSNRLGSQLAEFRR